MQDTDRAGIHGLRCRLVGRVLLQAGQSIAGVVAFDLPAKHGRLVLPHSDGEPQLVWKF
jgi:hypothetical protein